MREESGMGGGGGVGYGYLCCIRRICSRCRIFGPNGFYVQAACAAYGPKEVIHFEVDNVVSHPHLFCYFHC